MTGIWDRIQIRLTKTLKNWIERDLYKTYIHSWFWSFDKSRSETKKKSHTTYESIRNIYQIEIPQLVPKVLQQFTIIVHIVCGNVINYYYYYYYKEFLFAYRLGMRFSFEKSAFFVSEPARSVILWCWLYTCILIVTLVQSSRHVIFYETRCSYTHAKTQHAHSRVWRHSSLSVYIEIN